MPATEPHTDIAHVSKGPVRLSRKRQFTLLVFVTVLVGERGVCIADGGEFGAGE